MLSYHRHSSISGYQAYHYQSQVHTSVCGYIVRELTEVCTSVCPRTDWGTHLSQFADDIATYSSHRNPREQETDYKCIISQKSYTGVQSCASSSPLTKRKSLVWPRRKYTRHAQYAKPITAPELKVARRTLSWELRWTTTYTTKIRVYNAPRLSKIV